MRGLLGQKPLAQDEGFWISPCASIHTVGMRYAIDAVFLDRENRVIKIVENLRPLRFAQAFRARTTLELLAGAAQAHRFGIGDVLQWRTN